MILIFALLLYWVANWSWSEKEGLKGQLLNAAIVFSPTEVLLMVAEVVTNVIPKSR